MGFSAKGPQEFQVDPLLISAGQPDEARLREVLDEGATVVTLRRPHEDPFDEDRMVAAQRGRLIRLPTTPASFTDEHWKRQLFAIFDEVRDGVTKVYLHCGSANRTGAAWALYWADKTAADKAAALAEGRRTGMKAMEPTLDAVLDKS